ncbi:MAG: Ig-like domain-containing protein [Clostridia bacterium]|nr:Ig-like domain-containing protein [Clostridia bacterium]
MKKTISFIILLTLMLSLLPSIPTVAADAPVINVNMTKEDHDILHGSAGFLYGISNEGVPDVNTLTPLKPKVLATKGALGTEHPYGDALDVADEFFEAGGEQVQMYNSNYYGVFGVTANAYDYGTVLETIIAPHVASWKDTMREKYSDIDSRIVYIPINEGTPKNGVSSFEAAWKIYYDSIKKADPRAFIAGPNDADYRGHSGMYNYLKYCRDNNCLPDVVTWHELQVSDLQAMDSHIADYRSICRELGIEEKQIVINEYADYSDCGVPGRLVNWIARLEDNEVYGCLPFWHQANNLNDLTANANDGNGAWWVYKWYGDMSGKVLSLTTENTAFDGFYALASIDNAKQSATILAGGNDGKGIINLNNIAKTNVFKNAKNVHLKVEASYFTGYHGASGDPEVVMEGVFPVVNGNVSIELNDMLFSTAYRVTVTKTDETTPYVVKGNYHAFYEAEDALHCGSLIKEQESSPLETPRYFCSGRVRMGGFDQEGDAIEYKITIPHDGLYKLSFIYGNGVGSTRNNSSTHAPKNITQTLSIDGEEETIHLPNTLFYSMEGMVEKCVALKRGMHSVKLSYSGDEGAFHDVLYVSYIGAYEEDAPIYDKIFESEAADFNPESLAVTQTDNEGFSGNGYVTDLSVVPTEEKGGIRHVVHISESGLYNISFRYMSENDSKIRLFLDNTNYTYDNHLTDINAPSSSEWSEAYTTVFLRKGLNLIDYDMTTEGAIDYMRVTASGTDLSETYEAEASQGTFSTLTNSDATYVTPLLGSTNAHQTEGKYIELKVNAPEEGLYRMQVFQSNDELCGTHSYNIKIIDRYASFAVNGDYENAKRYFFPNTFSDDTFLERTIPLNLTKGENTIRIYNDDSWHVLWGGSKSEPGTNELINYTPNFDKFIITPAVADVPLRHTAYRVDVSSSDNGYAYADKNTAEIGEEVNLYLIPDGDITHLTLNGKDILPTVKSIDGNIYHTSFFIEEDTRISAVFTPAIEGDITEEAPKNEFITIDGKNYLIAGENLYKNPDFSDYTGKDMEQWYVGTNASGHPTDSTYQIPRISPDGTLENLTPLTSTGYLTTGGYEKDKADTFYYGKDSSNTYLVEHMHSNWQNCAWNGKGSLLSFVPIKENTNYYFSFRAFTVSGKASIRFGAIDMDEGESFYAPAGYNRAEGLNFTSSNYLNCNNGEMQNIGGKWTTHSIAFNSGDGADYFLFNAYWLQVCEYLCMGNFELYELSSSAITPVSDTPLLDVILVQKGDNFTLPDEIAATADNGDEVILGIEWLNEAAVDTSTSGTYAVTGNIICPDGYYTPNNRIRQRIIVTEHLCDIVSWELDGSSAKVDIRCYASKETSLIIASYDSDILKSVSTAPLTLVKDETLTITIPDISDGVKLFVWDRKTVKPLCIAKVIE